jgi:hypothetical protein
LTDSTSVKLGIGPVCRAKGTLKEKEIKQGDLFMVDAIEDFNEDIICSRDEDGIHTNIPRRITKHSPSGFEFGYGGSGPADFALNILSVFIGQEAAEKNFLYQEFKWQFVAKLAYHEGGTIPSEDILRWIEDKTGEKNDSY